jgi:hypothetical protein
MAGLQRRSVGCTVSPKGSSRITCGEPITTRGKPAYALSSTVCFPRERWRWIVATRRATDQPLPGTAPRQRGRGSSRRRRGPASSATSRRRCRCRAAPRWQPPGSVVDCRDQDEREQDERCRVRAQWKSQRHSSPCGGASVRAIYSSSRPSPRACSTASAREVTPSFRYAAIAWVFTVLRETISSSAIASKLKWVGR